MTRRLLAGALYCVFSTARAATLTDGCRHVFVDAGSNIGQHVKFLFEPRRYPQSVFGRVFDTYFGAKRDLNQTCAVSFEPNPAHRARHRRMAEDYARRGWRYVPYAAAVGPEGGNLTFFSNTRREQKFLRGSHEALGVGFGVNDRETGGELKAKYTFKHKQHAVTCPVVDFAAFLAREVAPREIPPARSVQDRWRPAVVVKMDIEGEEYALVPRLLETRALCAAVDFISLEWHDRKKFLPLKVGDITLGTEEEAARHTRTLRRALGAQSSEASCATHFRETLIDDESYAYGDKEAQVKGTARDSVFNSIHYFLHHFGNWH